MFDRIRPPEADAGGTIKGYALPGAVDARSGGQRARAGSAHSCGQCGARVQELRRGRCWGCYQAWMGLRPVGKGARCLVCAERRSDSLRLVELHGRSVPLCHGCAARTSRLSPVPFTIEGLRRALTRERRWEDRRLDALDPGLPRDRRQSDRRQPSTRAGAPSAEELGDFVLDVVIEEPEVVAITAAAEAPVAVAEAAVVIGEAPVVVAEAAVEAGAKL